MRDEEKRKKQRAAEAGDTQAQAELNREEARRGEGVIGFLLGLVGKQVWIEGVRINYRGVLVEVIRNSDGTCGALVLSPFQRISYFGKNGPDQFYTYTHNNPHLVPYECIHDIGEEGFVGSAWPKIS